MNPIQGDIQEIKSKHYSCDLLAHTRDNSMRDKELIRLGVCLAFKHMKRVIITTR